MLKNILQEYYSCSVHKTTPKNTKCSGIEIFLKSSHLGKAIAPAKAIASLKSSVWVKN